MAAKLHTTATAAIQSSPQRCFKASFLTQRLRTTVFQKFVGSLAANTLRSDAEPAATAAVEEPTAKPGRLTAAVRRQSAAARTYDHTGATGLRILAQKACKACEAEHRSAQAQTTNFLNKMDCGLQNAHEGNAEIKKSPKDGRKTGRVAACSAAPAQRLSVSAAPAPCPSGASAW